MHKAGTILRLLIGGLVLLVMVLFLLSNTETVHIGLWPTDYSLQAPLSVAVLIALGVGLLCGGLIVWMAELGQRRRARRAENAVRLLEAQILELKARLPAAPVLPHAP